MAIYTSTVDKLKLASHFNSKTSYLSNQEKGKGARLVSIETRNNSLEQYATMAKARKLICEVGVGE